MITRDNINTVLTELLTVKEINAELNKNNDHISLQVFSTNVGSYAVLESSDYSEEMEEEHNNNGQLFCDKDSFYILLSECNINL